MKRNEAKLRYINDLCEACAAITKKYAPEVNGHLSVREMSLRAIQAWFEQWAPHNQRVPPNGGWDWNAIRHSPRFAREVNVFRIAVWGQDDMLAGLSIGRSNKTAVCLEAVEAHPMLRPPIKGIILPVVLDCAAAYAQLTGRREIWLLEPASDELINLLFQTTNSSLSHRAVVSDTAAKRFSMATLSKLGMYFGSWKSKFGRRGNASSGGTHDGGGVRRPATGFVDKLPAEKQRSIREYKGSIFSGSSDLPRVKR